MPSPPPATSSSGWGSRPAAGLRGRRRIDALLAKLEEHGMTALGEHGDIDLARAGIFGRPGKQSAPEAGRRPGCTRGPDPPAGGDAAPIVAQMVTFSLSSHQMSQRQIS